ncbi:MAG: hypothetical protein MUF16_25495, partial [Burkholderiaceae bacterium]|nr:hypothetical protein [Burkholderiaceae bacterium]
MKLTKLAQTVILASAAFGASSAMAAACQVSDVTFSSTYPANQKNANACSNDLDGQGNTPNLAAMAALWGPGFVEGVTIEEAG